MNRAAYNNQNLDYGDDVDPLFFHQSSVRATQLWSGLF
jgi:hypothetical protein